MSIYFRIILKNPLTGRLTIQVIFNCFKKVNVKKSPNDLPNFSLKNLN